MEERRHGADGPRRRSTSRELSFPCPLVAQPEKPATVEAVVKLRGAGALDERHEDRLVGLTGFEPHPAHSIPRG